MCVDNSAEVFPSSLSAGGFGQEIGILGEDHAAEMSYAIQEIGILKLMTTIFVGRQDIYPPHT